MLKGKIEESKEIIRKAMNVSDPEAPLIINFSGGKDSIVVLLLATELTNDVVTLFMASSIDLPGSIEHAQKVSWQFKIPITITHPEPYQGTFFEIVRRWGYFPTSENGWCRGRLKIRPMRSHLRRLFKRKVLAKLTGVRRHESSRRQRIYKMNDVITADPEHSGSYLVHPILNWTDSDVMQYLAGQDIKLESPLYKQTGVSGCYWCPYYQDSIIERIERVFPGIYEDIIKLEEEIGKPSLSNHRYLRDVIARVQSQLQFSLT